MKAVKLPVMMMVVAAVVKSVTEAAAASDITINDEFVLNRVGTPRAVLEVLHNSDQYLQSWLLPNAAKSMTAETVIYLSKGLVDIFVHDPAARDLVKALLTRIGEVDQTRIGIYDRMNQVANELELDRPEGKEEHELRAMMRGLIAQFHASTKENVVLFFTSQGLGVDEAKRVQEVNPVIAAIIAFMDTFILKPFERFT